MPHIVSTDRQFQLLKSGEATEKHQQDITDYVKQEVSHRVYVDDKLIDPTDSLKQLGNYIHSDDFEIRLLAKLPSHCFFLDNPYRIGFRALVRTDPTSMTGYQTISAFERGIIPEHSIMELKTIEVPDIDVLARKKSISRNDLTKHEYVPGKGFVFDDTVARAGFRHEKQIGHEIKRGWRTILIYAIKEGVLTVTDAERLFGTKDHPSWAQNTGKRDVILPW